MCSLACIVPSRMGSIILATLFRKAEHLQASPGYVVGAELGDFLGKGFIAVSAVLGALGSFCSGAATASILTCAYFLCNRCGAAGDNLL
jgi:L-lactate permease